MMTHGEGMNALGSTGGRTSCQGEHRALRIDAVNDPLASGYFHRTVGDPAPTGRDTLARRADRTGVEVVLPERGRNQRRILAMKADGGELKCANGFGS